MVPLKFQLAVSTYQISKGSSAEETQAIDLNAHHAFYPLQTEVLEDSQIHSSIYQEMCYVVNDSMTLDVKTGSHLSQLEATLQNGCPGASGYLSLPEALSFLLAAVLWRRNFAG